MSDETPISEVEKRGLNLGSVSERRERDEIKAQDQQGTLKLWRSFWHRVTHSGPPPRAKSLTRKPRSVYCVQGTVYKKEMKCRIIIVSVLQVTLHIMTQ